MPDTKAKQLPWTTCCECGEKVTKRKSNLVSPGKRACKKHPSAQQAAKTSQYENAARLSKMMTDFAEKKRKEAEAKEKGGKTEAAIPIRKLTAAPAAEAPVEETGNTLCILCFKPSDKPLEDVKWTGTNKKIRLAKAQYQRLLRAEQRAGTDQLVAKVCVGCCKDTGLKAG